MENRLLMPRRRHNEFVSANGLQISVYNENSLAENRGDLFEKGAARDLVGRKKFSLRARLADAWLVRRPANFEGLVGVTPNECCPVPEG
jgi:hypothetical protein